MAKEFRIIKQTDRELVAAVGRIRKTLKDQRDFRLQVSIPTKGGIEISDEEPEKNKELEFYFSLDSQILDTIQILDVNNQPVLTIYREPEKSTDRVVIRDEWVNNRDENLKSILPQLYARLIALVRSELKVGLLDASLQSAHDSAIEQAQVRQTEVVNSLQQAAESLLIKAGEQNARLQEEREHRFQKLEEQLRDKIDAEKKLLESVHQKKMDELSKREKDLTEKEAGFETKEARYVARQKQGDQLKQIQGWIDEWSLTKGTTSKRRIILGAYISALVLTGALTIYATYHNYQLLQSADDLIKLHWWHWLAIVSKSLFPLAAFTTFMIYFIRWSSAWARQHADEEFTNRTRLIDIGRSSWLLEAVRDAQERNKEIPPELLKELSRNLFTHTASNDTDIQPQAAADILLQGLSSLRVKSADGTEVEAKRGK